MWEVQLGDDRDKILWEQWTMAIMMNLLEITSSMSKRWRRQIEACLLNSMT